LGSFWVEPRVKIWYQWRPNISPPSYINRCGFYGLEEEEIRSKVNKQSASPPPFLLSPWTFSSLSLSLSIMAFDHHHSYHWFDHHHLHYKSLPEHLTWWVHHLSLSLQTFFFSNNQPQPSTPPPVSPPVACQTGDAYCTPTTGKHLLLLLHLPRLSLSCIHNNNLFCMHGTKGKK